jgi:hypothetical protein
MVFLYNIVLFKAGSKCLPANKMVPSCLVERPVARMSQRPTDVPSTNGRPMCNFY